MKKAFLIQCHANSNQINDLISNLSSEKNIIDFYIHVDAKSPIIDEIKKASNVYFVKDRIDVRWGTVSQVLATLEMLKMTRGKGYDFVSLISGQDFPICSIDNFCEFLQLHSGKLFIEFEKLPIKKWRYNGGIGRISYFWIDKITFNRSKKWRIIRNMYLYTLGRLFSKKIQHLGNLYGGSQWFTVPGVSVDNILSFLEANKKYLKTYNNTGCSDEIFFQTYFVNNYKEDMINNNLRFIKWGNESSPLTLKCEDYNDIINSGCFFMRKVDPIISKELILKLKKNW